MYPQAILVQTRYNDNWLTLLLLTILTEIGVIVSTCTIIKHRYQLDSFGLQVTGLTSRS